MKVTFVAEFNQEEDGYDGSVTVVRKDVHDLHDLAVHSGDCATAVGYTWVKTACYECTNGDMIWGDH